jgi:hypothetical protein
MLQPREEARTPPPSTMLLTPPVFPAPVAMAAPDGSRLTVEVGQDGEVKVSFAGEVTPETFQLLQGILDLQKQMVKCEQPAD